MRHFALFFAVTAAAAVSCSAEDDGSPDTPESFCQQFAEAACNTEVVQACQAADDASCRTTQEAFCLDQLPATDFSGKTAGECLDAVEAAFADADLDATELGTVLRFEAPCDRLVRGPGGEGAACSARRDCDAPAGFDCVLHGSEAVGTCQLPVVTGPGEDCSAADAVCTTGFHCDGAHCIAGEGEGQRCVTQQECGPTRYCGLLSVCEERLPVRAACGFDEQCASGLCYSLSADEQVCTDRLRLSLSEPICEDLR